MPVEISKVQELHLQLMEAASFNSYDGEQVVSWLRENMDAWEAVFMVREYSTGIVLWDMQDNINNVDAVYILCSSSDAADRIALMAQKEWCADEAEVVKKEDVGKFLGSYPSEKGVCRLWWD